MRRIKWTDPNGWIRCAMIRDSDPDESASKGIPCDPPDVNLIDWEAVKRDLHNLLTERELITMADIYRKSEHIRSATQAVLYERLLELYKQSP